MVRRRIFDADECGMVRQFHQRFDQIAPDQISHLTRRKLQDRVLFMLEELTEFAAAAGLNSLSASLLAEADATRDYDLALLQSQNMEGMFDALLDLVYVAKGTAVMMGLDQVWDQGFADVQRANMTKVLGETHRGNKHDVAKPPGWVGPQTAAVLALGNYDPALAADESKHLDDKVHQND